MKLLNLTRDIIEINLPNGLTFSVITFAEIKDLAGIILALTSAVCTVILTRHKTKKSHERRNANHEETES